MSFPGKENAMCAWHRVNWGPDKGVHLDRAGHTATPIGPNIYIAFGGNGTTFFTDVLVFDTRSGRVARPVSKLPPGVRPRSNHTATLIGSRIWFIAGNDVDDVFGDVITLDIHTNSWQVVRVNDPHALLQRTAHAAEVHPRLPANILLMGGYGPVDDAAPGEYDMHNDLIMLDTQNCSTERLAHFHGSVPPTPRAWHTMNALGDRLYIFGGRNVAGIVGDGDASLLVVYDVVSNHWLRPPVSGRPPSPRSSHRTVVMGNRIILYGGASAGDDLRMKERMNDVHSLVVQPSGQLVWSTCDTPQQGSLVPQARSAHTMTLIGTTAFVICGYNGNKSAKDKHAADCWALSLLPDAFERSNPALAAAAAAAARGPPGGVPVTNGVMAPWAAGATAAVAAVAPAGGTAAVAAAPAGVAEGNDADASAWRTVKRQRSGPTAADRQQQQQQFVPQPMHQQHHHNQQQQQQQALPGSDQALTTAAAAMAAAVAGVMAAPGSPLRHPGSPLRDGYGMYLQQQEVEALRTRTTSLETELRLLQQQLAHARADARQDKQLAEQRLQELLASREEASRQRTQAEQLLVRQQRAQEEAVLAQQDLATAKQQLQKAELERDAAQQQAQVLHGEARKLRHQQGDGDKQLQAAQLQLQQAAATERRLQEQLEQLHKQQADDARQARAAEEQHRKELQRLTDTMAEEQRQHAAALQQQKQHEASQQQLLDDKGARITELQAQLQAAQATAADAAKQKEDAVALQITTRDQLNALNNSHKAVLQERDALASQVAKLREDADTLKSAAEHHKSSGRAVTAALAQAQAAMQTLANAAAQLSS